MDFDHLLRKYLSGAISDAELEHFQALLDRVPEYKTELRQTLEIRSLLHDDALTLTPPPDLSDHVRIAVSSSFAADALAEQEEVARKRRVYLYPLRITAGVFTAACLLVGVALSPTLPHDAARPQARAAAPAPSVEAPSVETPSLATPAPAVADATRPDAAPRGRTMVPDRGNRDVAKADEKFIEQNLWMLGHEVPHRVATDDLSAPDGNSQSIASRLDPEALRPADLASAFSNSNSSDGQLLSYNPADLLNRHHALPFAYNPAVESETHRDAIGSSESPKPGESIAMSGDDWRKLSFGVTIGTGQVAETESPTALLQNSYYLSFSVSNADRIGVEMGASAFQQEVRIPDGFAKKQQPGDPLIAGNGLGLLSGTNNGGGDASGDLPEKYFVKVTAAPQESPNPKGRGGAAPQSASSQVTPPRDPEKRIEQQITYGAVFYDRRIKLSRSWDVCGRVTLGGADNAVMGNVRAYAAYTFSKNVTVTMGVGGATLYNFTSKGENSSSGNYGVYYGIETGF